MRIESATVENHRFGVARRRGYDPDEVDAVMSRVADTLAQYERMIQRLEERLEASTITQDDIKSVVAVQENKNKLLAQAKTAAAQIVDAATDEASAIRNEATLTADRIIGAADDHLSAAQMDAQRIREEADSLIDLAHERSDELRGQAEVILTSAIADAERTREEAEAAAIVQATEAEKMLHLAQAEANQLAVAASELSEAARRDIDAEVAEVLAQARRQAEAMINSAIEETRLIRQRLGSEMDELRLAKEGQAEQLIATARNEAAEIRAAAAATAEALGAQGRADAEDLVAQARNDALDRLTTAQEEAEHVLTEASHQADSIVATSRENNRRLAQRTSQLQAAVSEFEAHIANLAEVAGDRTGLIKDMIGQHLERQNREERHETTATNTGAPTRAPRKGSRAKKDRKGASPAPMADYAEPDGSGRLPARRPTVAAVADPWNETLVAIDIVEQEYADDEFVYDGAGGSEDAPLEEATADDGSESKATDQGDSDEAVTGTIYQRRGGGIKRRVAAMHVIENDEAS